MSFLLQNVLEPSPSMSREGQASRSSGLPQQQPNYLCRHHRRRCVHGDAVIVEDGNRAEVAEVKESDWPLSASYGLLELLDHVLTCVRERTSRGVVVILGVATSLAASVAAGKCAAGRGVLPACHTHHINKGG